MTSTPAGGDGRAATAAALPYRAAVVRNARRRRVRRIAWNAVGLAVFAVMRGTPARGMHVAGPIATLYGKPGDGASPAPGTGAGPAGRA